MKALSILGSTGSIGRQTLDVVRAFPQKLRVVGLAAGYNLDLLAQQIREFSPQVISCQGPEADVARILPNGCRRVSLEEVASYPEADLVVAATVSSVGLRPFLSAVAAGKPVALANKEVIVMAGELVTQAARGRGVELLPVDSEPSAIWQCLRGEDREVSRLLITASGGAFRQRPLEELEHVTRKEALHHPTWQMGKKITVDSATLMNKAFEVIEAYWLFGVPWERIQVVIHPQSIIHSMVEFSDGSVKAQLSPPDMHLPIQYALFYPQRQANENLPRFDPVATSALTFEALDEARYPCFRLALDAAKAGGTYPAVLSAADEVAVDLFLEERIKFLGIYSLVERVLSQHHSVMHPTLEEILAADAWARQQASLGV